MDTSAADASDTPGAALVAAPAHAPEPAPPASAMSIHAHPDDQEFTVGGTLAKWARAGCCIVSVCITSGEAGSNDSTPAEMTRDRLLPIREEEQRRACRALGIDEVVFLRYPDGALEATVGLRRDLTRLVRRHRPAAVVCGDPTMRFYGSIYINHPDHRAAAEAAIYAVFPSAETRFIFPELLDEGLAVHKVQSLYLHGSDRADTFVDIADVLDVKLAALREHKSQMGDWDPTEMITGWAGEQGRPRRLKAAEAYRRMTLHETD